MTDATTQGAEPEVSVVLPCLDEAATIVACIQDARGCLGAAGVAHEVIVADNGSTDGSRERARAAGARVIEVAVRGYGAAVLAGIGAARAPYVVIADADRSYALDALMPLVERLRTGDDLVVGDRFRGGIAPGAMPPLHRWVGNPVLSWVARVLFDTGLRDLLCGIRAIRRDAALGLPLRQNGFAGAAELVIAARLAGLRLSSVPTTLRADGRGGPSHLRTWTHGWEILRVIVGMRLRGRRGGR